MQSRWYGRSKYNAHKVFINGIKFDSKKEADRYLELKALEQAGEISNLTLQKRYELTPEVREPDIIGPKGGVKKGRVVELPSYYIADFVYKDVDGNTVVEDVKSPATKTPQYILKRKMMLYRYGIRISEV